jgi:arabinofuranosyltransferase
MLAMALVQRLGLDPALWSRAISAASGVALLALLARALPSGPREARAGAALFFAVLPPVAVWSTGGLESMPFALAVFASYAALAARDDRPRPLLGALAGSLAVLLRADGAVWLVLALGAALLQRPERLAAVLRAALAAGAVLLLHVLWRRGFYGEWLPNTARAKVHLGWLGLERGLKYVASLALAVLSVPLALGLGLRGLAGPAGRTCAAALCFAAGGFAYLALVGGDWMMMFRQLVPVMPFLALAAAGGLVSLRARAARVATALLLVVLSLLPAFDLHPVPRAVRTLAHFRFGSPELSEHQMWKKGVLDIGEWIALGKALAPHVAPGESVVLGNIGAIPFYSGLVAYDTLGLTNREPFAPPPDPASPEARRMPGHDRIVEMATFDKYEPTYRGLSLGSAADPRAGLPQNWFEPAAAAKLEIEIVPLCDAAGAPTGRVLRMARNKW